MTQAIRLVVIDDHPLFREGVTRSLTEIGGFEVVGEGSSAEDALRLAGEEAPDIILLDISLPGGGLNAIAPILGHRPSQKIVMLTVSEDSEDLAAALNSGAQGYVLKGVGSRTLAEILRSVAAGERYVSPTLSARLLSALSNASQASPLAELSPREREILVLVADGLSNKRIGLKLNLHEKTIKHHMSRILATLKVSNRTEAAMVLRDLAEKERREPVARLWDLTVIADRASGCCPFGGATVDDGAALGVLHPIAAAAELLAQPVAMNDLDPPWVGVEDIAGVRIRRRA